MCKKKSIPERRQTESAIESLRPSKKPKKQEIDEIYTCSPPTYIYRVIRSDEDITKGIFAKNPYREMTIEGHVVSGSRNKGSQFISATTQLSVAKEYAKKSSYRILQIDLRKIPENVQIIDLSTPWRDCLLNGIRSKNYARASSEVVFDGHAGHIPSEALKNNARYLCFWKEKKPSEMKASDVYQALHDGTKLDFVYDLPIEQILNNLKNVFCDWNQINAYNYEKDCASIEIFANSQIFRFDCYSVTEADINKIINFMRTYECPLYYDPAIDVRK